MRIQSLTLTLTLSLLAGCGSTPEAVPTESDTHSSSVAQASDPDSSTPADTLDSFLAAPMGDVAAPSQPETESGDEQQVEAASEPVSAPEMEVLEAPPELTVEFLQQLKDQMHRDIRWGQPEVGRQRFAVVADRLDFEPEDSRSEIAERLRALDGFLRVRIEAGGAGSTAR